MGERRGSLAPGPSTGLGCILCTSLPQCGGSLWEEVFALCPGVLSRLCRVGSVPWSGPCAAAHHLQPLMPCAGGETPREDSPGRTGTQPFDLSCLHHMMCSW